MSIKEDIEKVEEKVEKIEKQSYAMEFLSDYKKTNVRMFIMWLITFVALSGLVCYTIYLLNDIGVIEDDNNIDIQDVESIDNSHIKIGDDVWEKSK